MDDTDAGTQAGTDIDVHAYTLTVEDAAPLLGKSVDTVRRYIRQGKLSHTRVQGGRTVEYRLRPDDVTDLRDRQDAVEGEPAMGGDPPPAATPTQAGTRPTEARVQASTDARRQTLALMHALVEPLVEEVRQARQELGDTREELGRERALREAADARVRALERQTHPPRPWWLRMILGRS